ncbi:cell wall-associated NlpC family hydrolase [Kibdelosporangium banguiense]|uniref:Cell wall-associated NlpC family hydrolase n=1 Tax=Kibdelosporangium banguiense TaxID=1365924 RepID=A0ABS4TME9_9PSEU|nr:NlpC/P60 family protein [Kibdelosporangium banguiense]MBP2325591.1 cell wall-associated NlpC family hydrolase [Kibdelosporangium banguiense]
MRVCRAAIPVLAAVLVLAATPCAFAVPPPPPKPSDQEIQDSKANRDAKAGRVGELTNQLAAAETKLIDLQAAVELKMEDANKALVDLDNARDEAAKARSLATAAKTEADAASAAIAQVHKEVDDFAAASFRQGSTVGSITAFLGAKSPQDLLDRAALLNAVSGSQIDALERMQRARIEQANKESLARAAVNTANEKQTAAENAKRVADNATRAAEQARRSQAGEAAQIEAAKAQTEQELTRAQAEVGGLESQLQRYREWQAAKQREDEERAKQAAAAAAANKPGGGARPSRPAPGRPAVVGGGPAVVIARALSQLGMPYAWGGGNAHGPTRGIRDGGIADSFGDYAKVGFDCSGLMIYAFAGVGVGLPHYSGYQADAGRRVPLSQMAPGDMLFWATGGRIHHVALYIGNGQMVEAPYSGSRVRIAPVRYGGIVPYAARVF